MKRLLFVSSGLTTSNTSAAIRNRRLVSELKKHFDIYAIDVAPAGTPASYDIDGIESTIIESSVYAARNIGVRGRDGFLGKIRRLAKHLIRSILPDKYFIELLFHDFSTVFQEQGKFDVVLTSSDPKGVHACLLNRSFRKRFVDEDTRIIEYWGDPWYGDINFYTNGVTRNIERYLFGRADHVVFNSMATYREKSTQSEGVSQFHFLSRGVEGDLERLPDVLTRTFDRVRLLYAGDYFSVSRNIMPLIRAVGRLSDSLVIVGDGDSVQDVPANVRLLPRVDFATARRMTSEADMLVVLLNRVGGQMPGKLYDYASTEHPVLVLYEDSQLLSAVPFQDRFIFVRNDEASIYAFLKGERQFDVSFRSVKKASFSSEVSRLLKDCDLVECKADD